MTETNTRVVGREIWIDFANYSDHGRAAEWYAKVAALGYHGVVLDTWSPALREDVHNAHGAGLSVMFNQGYLPAAWRVPHEAQTRAEAGARTLKELGAPLETALFLDCEAMAIPRETAIAWIDEWSITAATAGLTGLGVYEGANCPLLALDWERPHIPYRWKSASIVPEVPAGYHIRQLETPTSLYGLPIDADVVIPDGTPLRAWAPASATPAAPVPLSEPKPPEPPQEPAPPVTEPIAPAPATPEPAPAPDIMHAIRTTVIGSGATVSLHNTGRRNAAGDPLYIISNANGE